MPLKFDDTDRKIILELQRDSRQAMSAIAGRIGLSRNAVRQRIERMERDRIITGYTVRLASGDSSRRNISAFLFITRHDRMRGADVISAIRRIPEVSICHVLSGEKDLLVRLDAPSQDRVREVWHDLSQLAGVRDICTCFSLSTVLDRSA